jgi:hypothetical protein
MTFKRIWVELQEAESCRYVKDLLVGFCIAACRKTRL